MPSTVVWDWNGTLFGDADAMIASTVDAFTAAGLPPVTAERYRALHVQPIPTFYDRLAGRPLTPAEQRKLATGYLAAYLTRRDTCTLSPGATAALRAVAARGVTQSLLSMYPHDELLPLVARFDLTALLSRVDGYRTGDSGAKSAHLSAHLTALGVDPSQTVLIGDSADDARAAASVGARCVLYASGLHDHAALAATGAPVTTTLAAAVTTALDLP